MKFFKHFVLIIVVVVLQISVVPNLAIAGTYPNLILIGMLVLFFSSQKTPALWWAGFGGLSLDIFSTLHYGLFTISFLGSYFLLVFISDRFISSFSFLTIIIGFFAASLIIDLIPFLVSDKNWPILVGNAIYTVLVGIIIFYFISDKLQPKRGEYRI